jgi:hypothetical protein
VKPSRFAAAPAIAALALAFPAAAAASPPIELAQSTTPRNAPPLQGGPPPGGARRAAPRATSRGPRLPATGGQPGLIGLAGFGLVLSGLGLRLREPGG